MSALVDIIEYVATEAAAVQDFPVMMGPMPAPESVSVAYGSGATDTTFLDKGVSLNLSVVVNGKSADQAGILDAIATIHQALVQTKDYPTATDGSWQVTDVTTAAAPDYIGREDEDRYLYGSTLTVRAWLPKPIEELDDNGS
jgi:hypothetical protein